MKGHKRPADPQIMSRQALVQVLSNIPAPYWNQAKPAMGDFSEVRARIKDILSIPNNSYGTTVDTIERNTGDKLR